MFPASTTVLLASIFSAQLMYAFPLIVAISLVYGATRHEEMSRILGHAVRGAIWILVFMAIIFALLWFAGYGL